MRSHLDPLVDEDHPGLGDGAQPGVAGGGGAAVLPGQHGGAGAQVTEDGQRVFQRRRVGLGLLGPVVDQDDAVGARAVGGGQCGEAVGEGVPTRVGTTTAYGVIAGPSPAHGVRPGRGGAVVVVLLLVERGVVTGVVHGEWAPSLRMRSAAGWRVPRPSCLKPFDPACPALHQRAPRWRSAQVGGRLRRDLNQNKVHPSGRHRRPPGGDLRTGTPVARLPTGWVGPGRPPEGARGTARPGPRRPAPGARQHPAPPLTAGTLRKPAPRGPACAHPCRPSGTTARRLGGFRQRPSGARGTARPALDGPHPA